MNSITTCRKALAQLLRDDATLSDLLNEVHDFRTFKNALAKTARVTCVGGNPFDTRTLGGARAHYDFAIPVFVVHDGTLESEEKAEDLLDAIEEAIYQALLAWPVSEAWTSMSFPHDSIRPKAPPELPLTRIMEIYVRVTPR